MGNSETEEEQEKKKKPWFNGPDLTDFLSKQGKKEEEISLPSIASHYLDQQQKHDTISRKKVYVETYGCQMNVSDTEIVYSVMKQAGYDKCDNMETADVLFLNTCAIRDNAEKKIWHRLEYIRDLKKQKYFETSGGKQPIVGILGCMAERLKDSLLEKEKLVDIVAGPDAYRDLPRLVHSIDHEEQKYGINVILSADETYADITPVRHTSTGVSAFLTIMRGCNNMCSYCIVPFTRGRERSRPITSILEEVKQLSEQGFKEIVLLGQNVNSYCDSETALNDSNGLGLKEDGTPALSNDGFKTIYKPKKGGIRFTELVDRVSKVDPEMRIRFTSPHPKDFPDDLLQLIRDRPNVCKQIHVPAQSGNTEVLERMRRGYSREAYMSLVKNIREAIPGVALSSDFIAGFCGETEQQHQDTISLLEEVKYEQAYLFAYSLREKTHAHRKFIDDVPADVKNRRLNELIEVYRRNLLPRLEAQIGTIQLVLIDGTSRRGEDEWIGRTDSNMKILIKKGKVPIDESIRSQYNSESIELKPGDYVETQVVSLRGRTLVGNAICKTSLQSFFIKHKS
jgi:MiaB/RimO family radical SAM methylthiotransferase